MSELNDPLQKLTLLVKVNKLRKTFYKCGSVTVWRYEMQLSISETDCSLFAGETGQH